MQKKVTRLNQIIAFCFLAITAVTVFNACKKAGFNDGILHDKDFAEKFFETRAPVNDDVARIIEMLKTENERTGFVNKLPANCGLPVWEKLILHIENNEQPVNSGYNRSNHGPAANPAIFADSTTNIAIPLTLYGANLSAVMLVTITSGSVTINTLLTNEYLYNVSHGTSVDTTFATRALTLFFYMENRTFGNTTFYNIPANLFPAYQDLDSNGNKTIQIKNDTTNTGNVAPAEWICVEYQIPYECPPSISGGCYHTLEVCTPIEDPGNGGTGGGSTGGGGPTGGGGGTGGGSTGSGGNCNQQVAWYSFLSEQCNGNGGGYNPNFGTMITLDTSITNNFPCLANLLMNMPFCNIDAQQFLYNTFGTKTAINLHFKIDWTYSPNSLDDAETTRGAGTWMTPSGIADTIWHYTDTILINPYMLQNAAKEYLVGVLYHESLHAFINWQYFRLAAGEIDSNYIKNKFPIFWTNLQTNTYNSQHEQMAATYVNTIAGLVKLNFNPAAPDSIQNRVSNSIAWGGLEETTAWRQPGRDTCRINKENQAARYSQSSQTYSTATCGTTITSAVNDLKLSQPCH